MVKTFLLLLALISFEAKDYITFFGTTDQTVTVAWDEVPTATLYELQLHHQEQQVYISIGSTTETTFTFSLPRSGHYIAMVRAVNSEGESIWSKSTDPDVAAPKPWWIYGYIAPPGGIIIE